MYKWALLPLPNRPRHRLPCIRSCSLYSVDLLVDIKIRFKRRDLTDLFYPIQTDDAKVTTEKNGESASGSTGAPTPQTSPSKSESKTESSTKGKRYLYGSNSICCPREAMEMTTMMKDGMIEDWDLFENRFEIGPVTDH